MKITILISFILFVQIAFCESDFSEKNECSNFNFTTSCTHLSTNINLVVSKNLLATNEGTELSDLVKAKRLKISGAVFTAIGGVGLIGTTILTGILVHSYNNQSSTTNREFAQIGIIIPAFLGYASSAVMLSVGLPQLGVAIHKVKKYKKAISK